MVVRTDRGVHQTQQSDAEFAYRPNFYIDLPGSLDSKDRKEGSADAHTAPDVVSWILSSDFRRGWLIGGIGSGKTIALTCVGAKAARGWIDWFNQVRHGAGINPLTAPPVPILMKCSTLFAFRAEDTVREVTSTLLFENMARTLGKTASEFEAFLSGWKCLVLLDALDEVPDANAEEHIDALLLKLSYLARDLRVVVTMRAPDFRPVFEESEVIKIQPLSTERGTALVNRIVEARADIRPRMTQVLRIMDDARAKGERHFLNSPQTLTMACLLANQDVDFPVDMRFSELLDRWLTASCAPDETYAIDRRVLKAIALKAMSAGQPWVEITEISDVLRKAGLSPESPSLRRELDRLTGIVVTGHMWNGRYIEFGHASLRDYLSAEAVADDWTERALLARARREFEKGWKGVVEFLPAVLSRRSRSSDAEVLLRDLTEAANNEQNDDEAPKIWLTGLRAVFNDATLQGSEAAREFIRSTHAATTRSECRWKVHTRAEVLDACGLAGRAFFADLLPKPWVPIPELTTQGRTLSIASAPVTVEAYKDFLSSPDSRRRECWPPGMKASFVYEFEEGAWFEQMRTPLRPVTGVTWFEAMAYCAWLTCQARERKLQQVFRLPSPDEWRVVAQPGGVVREYPWDPPEMRNFNYRGTGLRRSSSVGLFPSYCRSGLFDFGTNVYEWSSRISDRNAADAYVLGAFWGDYIADLCIGRSKIVYPRADRRSDTGFRIILEEKA